MMGNILYFDYVGYMNVHISLTDRTKHLWKVSFTLYILYFNELSLEIKHPTSSQDGA